MKSREKKHSIPMLHVEKSKLQTAASDTQWPEADVEEDATFL